MHGANRRVGAPRVQAPAVRSTRGTSLFVGGFAARDDEQRRGENQRLTQLAAAAVVNRG